MIKLEDIEKRLAVKKADGMTNPDGTEPKENQQDVPDAKSSRTRSPWVDAGIGAAGGGLLGSALGYLYGHKGKWLAYDAIAGGLAGGGLGYMVGNSNNTSIKQKENKEKVLDPLSVKGKRESDLEKKMRRRNELREEYRQGKERLAKIESEGGASSGLPVRLEKINNAASEEEYINKQINNEKERALNHGRATFGYNGESAGVTTVPPFVEKAMKTEEANLAAAGLMKNPDPFSPRRIIPKYLYK